MPTSHSETVGGARGLLRGRRYPPPQPSAGRAAFFEDATIPLRSRRWGARPSSNPLLSQTTATPSSAKRAAPAPSVSVATALAALTAGPSEPISGAAPGKLVVLVAGELDAARSSVSGTPADGCGGTKRTRRSAPSQQRRAEARLGCDLCRHGGTTRR
ncbi:hypothetical protein GUJ93_ZPchr0016g2521 [Zizania palustris]|uniref:Uncharacterized protein n=1 Tax=Zizania palustris TaxID=103762 RepID=A0A8J5TGM6_ZIZPA|nr:hypothetical protein GUJ93_ZPchr0016g2521 [Zizania palustris]